MNNYKSFCEVDVSTASTNCHYLGSGMFDFTMGQYINIEPGEDMFLGGKNVRWRKKKHSMRIGVKLMPRGSSFGEDDLDFDEIHYSSPEELAMLIEGLANKSLEQKPNMCMDFSTKEKHLCIDSTVIPYTISLCFKYDRFFLRIHHDLMLVLSRSLADSLDLYPPGSRHGNSVAYEKNAYRSDYIGLFSPSARSFTLVIYDMITDFRITQNGSRYPVLFDFCGHDKYKCYEMLGVRKLIRTENVRQFRFQIFDREMRPIDMIDDYKTRPLEFTLMFLTL